jgi:hypothetical protein
VLGDEDGDGEEEMALVLLLGTTDWKEETLLLIWGTRTAFVDMDKGEGISSEGTDGEDGEDGEEDSEMEDVEFLRSKVIGEVSSPPSPPCKVRMN